MAGQLNLYDFFKGATRFTKMFFVKSHPTDDASVNKYLEVSEKKIIP